MKQTTAYIVQFRVDNQWKSWEKCENYDRAMECYNNFERDFGEEFEKKRILKEIVLRFEEVEAEANYDPFHGFNLDDGDDIDA